MVTLKAPAFTLLCLDFLFGHCGLPEDARFSFYFDLSGLQTRELWLLLDQLRDLRQTWSDLSTQIVVNDFLTNVR